MRTALAAPMEPTNLIDDYALAGDAVPPQRLEQARAFVDAQHGGDGGDHELRAVGVPEDALHQLDALPQHLQPLHHLVLAAACPEQAADSRRGTAQLLAQPAAQQCPPHARSVHDNDDDVSGAQCLKPCDICPGKAHGCNSSKCACWAQQPLQLLRLP
jgi:hypothetical protein